MKEPHWPFCTEQEMLHWVAVHLEQAGIECTLVGSAVAVIHLAGVYNSGDLDVVIESFPLPSESRLKNVFGSMCFQKKGMTCQHESDKCKVSFTFQRIVSSRE